MNANRILLKVQRRNELCSIMIFICTHNSKTNNQAETRSMKTKFNIATKRVKCKSKFIIGHDGIPHNIY